MSCGKHSVCFLNSFSSSNHCINAAFYLFFSLLQFANMSVFLKEMVGFFCVCVSFFFPFFPPLDCSLCIYLNGACQNNPSLTKSSEDVCRRVASASLPEELSSHPLLGSQLPWPRPVDAREQWEPGKPRTAKEDWCSSKHCAVLCCNRTPRLVGSGWVTRTFLWALFYSCPTEHAASLLGQDCV